MKNRNFIFIILALIIPFFIPYCGFLKEILPYVLSVMLFFNFINLEPGIIKFRKEYFYYPAFALLIFCPFALLLSGLCGIENCTGIILLAAAPTAVSSPVMADFIGADKKLSVMLAVISNLLAPLILSVAAFLYLPEKINFSFTDAAIKSASVIFIPLAAALLCSLLHISKNLAKASGLSGTILFPVIIFAAVMSSRNSILEAEKTDLVFPALAAFILCAVSFATGFFASKNKATAKSLSLLFGHKNTALSVYVALASASSEAVTPILFYIIFHHLANSILSFVFRYATPK
ncbi:MAG: hypothetical protein KAZ87_02055 [Spirochaetes bacterium]|nr:hypothetical protein [Spirochaetota bacterium]